MDDYNRSSLLYPAMHKLYSALRSLEHFNKGNNLFDNISYLDIFFSEYRNITFMLQKSLKGTSFEQIYIKNRDKYFTGEASKWFIEKRNEVLKEHPFDLQKKIKIILYIPNNSIVLSEEVFDIGNEISITDTIESVRLLFHGLNSIEIFFSVEFSFYEKDFDEEFLEDVIIGVHNMIEFMNAMRKDIGEECSLCNQLQDKIKQFHFFKIPKEVLFVDDYVYYNQEDQFEKASKGFVFYPENFFKKHRTPLSNLTRMFSDNNDKINEFEAFVIMHIMALDQKGTLMPTFLIIYEDDTFEFMSYLSSIKTVTYRKINEIAERVKIDKIKKVFYATEMISYNIKNYNKIIKFASPYREKYKEKDKLACYQIDICGDNKACYFDKDKVNNVEYVVSKLWSMSQDTVIGISFLQPIINAFKSL
ncbi:hypothetical protein [Apibacter sp. HY039]|uniref:hypothetical protein n=1 Tax=Apibacter sp. HY039 TaxID=2501476 RepID=UPI0013E2C8BC|nr:hypothetical protein [Apibacter sp. HY039]